MDLLLRIIYAYSNTNQFIWDDIKLGMKGGTAWAY